MRIAILGAGAIGGYYGARLARGGHDVVFIARGAHLAAMREQGLRVERDDGAFTVAPVQATDDARAVGPVHLVLVTCKAYQLDEAARAIPPLLGQGTVVLPLLNGADIVPRLCRHLPAERVLGGLTYLYASITEPGVIRQPGRETPLVFGEAGGGASARTEALAAAFEQVGLNAQRSDDVTRAIWTKFLMIAPNAGVCALTGQTLGPVLADPDAGALLAACQQEVVALANAQGIALGEAELADTARFNEGAGWHAKPSMLLDLERGRPLELETLNGAVVRLGREHGVSTPTHGRIYAALKHRAAGAG